MWVDVIGAVWLVDPRQEESDYRTLRRTEPTGEKLEMRLTQSTMDQLTEARLKHQNYAKH